MRNKHYRKFEPFYIKGSTSYELNIVKLNGLIMLISFAIFCLTSPIPGALFVLCSIVFSPLIFFILCSYNINETLFYENYIYIRHRFSQNRSVHHRRIQSIEVNSRPWGSGYTMGGHPDFNSLHIAIIARLSNNKRVTFLRVFALDEDGQRLDSILADLEDYFGAANIPMHVQRNVFSGYH